MDVVEEANGFHAENGHAKPRGAHPSALPHWRFSCSAMASAHCDALPAWSLSEEAIFLYQARLRCRNVTSFVMCWGSKAVSCFSAIEV